MIDAIITSDSDTLVFGAHTILRTYVEYLRIYIIHKLMIVKVSLAKRSTLKTNMKL